MPIKRSRNKKTTDILKNSTERINFRLDRIKST